VNDLIVDGGTKRKRILRSGGGSVVALERRARTGVANHFLADYFEIRGGDAFLNHASELRQDLEDQQAAAAHFVEFAGAFPNDHAQIVRRCSGGPGCGRPAA
jgi:hypothetical protein